MREDEHGLNVSERVSAERVLKVVNAVKTTWGSPQRPDKALSALWKDSSESKCEAKSFDS